MFWKIGKISAYSIGTFAVSYNTVDFLPESRYKYNFKGYLNSTYNFFRLSYIGGICFLDYFLLVKSLKSEIE